VYFLVTAIVLVSIAGFVLAQAELTDTRNLLIVKSLPMQNNAVVDAYVKTHEEFEGVNYAVLSQDTQTRLQLRAGNLPEELKGVQTATERYALQLMMCDRQSQSCSFRVNGKSTGELYAHPGVNHANAVALDEKFILKIDKITFDFCDNRRFCDSNFQAYDLVDTSIIPIGKVTS
jgi:hypothetical protein